MSFAPFCFGSVQKTDLTQRAQSKCTEVTEKNFGR